MFDSPPKYRQILNCKKCGAEISAGDSFCAKCGAQFLLTDKDIQNKTFTEKDIISVYNYSYNSGDKLITKECSQAIEAIITRLYGSFPVDTTMIINSSYRSGYALRKAEELVYAKKRPKEKVDWKEVEKVVSKSENKIETSDENANKILQLSIYLSDNKNFVFYSSENFINKYLNGMIKDNLNYMLPMLDRIYTGKEYMSISGFPYVYEKEINFNENIKNAWIDNITLDSVGGYTLRLAEFLLNS